MAMAIYSFVSSDDFAKWFIFLTIWSMLSCVIQSILSAVAYTQVFLKWRRNKDLQNRGFVERIYWHFYNVVMPLLLFISVAYWSVIHDPENSPMDFANIVNHILTTVLLLVDLVVAGHPLKILRFYYVDILLLIYAIFSYIYYVLGGTGIFGNRYIYPVLDWDKPGPSLIFCVICAIAGPIFHLIVWSFYRLRLFVVLKWFQKEKPGEFGSSDAQLHI
jgi:hypothetical protein